MDNRKRTPPEVGFAVDIVQRGVDGRADRCLRIANADRDIEDRQEALADIEALRLAADEN